MMPDMKIEDHDVWSDETWAVGQDFQLYGAELSPPIKNAHEFGGPTISPSDILVNQAHGSAVGLSSPYSLFDSPSPRYSISPHFDNEDIEQNWSSLFPDATPDSEDSGISGRSLSIGHEGSPASTESPDTSPRFRSSAGSGKRSSTSGIRKRTAPLPPIVVEDPSDVIAMKRARNTLAARKSRAKKAEKMDDMQQTIEELRAEVEHWKNLYHGQVGQ